MPAAHLLAALFQMLSVGHFACFVHKVEIRNYKFEIGVIEMGESRLFS